MIYLLIEGQDSPLHLISNPTKTESSVFELPNVVEIITSDEEVFPVKRRLLRPCISLTSLVQAGKGKYSLSSPSPSSSSASASLQEATTPTHSKAHVPVDACTFDRILLFLEHEARQELFKFDPLIANELLVASQLLQISQLQQLCEKILGSFLERVRKIPIRYQEVVDRNEQGRLVGLRTGKRGDTLLILNGMVLDITRWLDEHPGGSTIIPEQALNIDCTIFFEIYHASRQSFLYLKEFYIGEIDEQDLPFIPKANRGGATEQNTPSLAFLDQLNKVTAWRLKPDDLTRYVSYKSF
jgi:cytochrome b involved in lipid metabolism